MGALRGDDFAYRWRDFRGESPDDVGGGRTEEVHRIDHVEDVAADALGEGDLGGNDPCIVLPDADSLAIAEPLFWSMFLLNGQACIGLKRLFVHEDLYDALTQAICACAARQRVGDGFDPEATLPAPTPSAATINPIIPSICHSPPAARSLASPATSENRSRQPAPSEPRF